MGGKELWGTHTRGGEAFSFRRRLYTDRNWRRTTTSTAAGKPEGSVSRTCRTVRRTGPESALHLREFRNRAVKSALSRIFPRGGPISGKDIQSFVHLRRGGVGENAFDPGHLPSYKK